MASMSISNIIDDAEVMDVVYDLAYGTAEDIEFDADANGVTEALLGIPVWLFPDPQGRYVSEHVFSKGEIQSYIDDLENVYIALPDSHTADLLLRYIEVADFWFDRRF